MKTTPERGGEGDIDVYEGWIVIKQRGMKKKDVTVLKQSNCKRITKGAWNAVYQQEWD